MYAFGERKTPDAFIAARDRFIFTEVLKQPATGAAPQAPVPVQDVPALHWLLSHAIEEPQRYTGYASLFAVGSFIGKNRASFDPRNYCFSKLSELVRKQQQYLDVKETIDAAGFTHLK